MADLAIRQTAIPGLLVVDLDVREDNRGWFKENWQRAKMTGLGLPDFTPVQNNLSFNLARGVTRGIHAEPWDKYVSMASGRAFGAWVDLRDGPTFGTVVSLELSPAVAVFVPRGVGNAYQAREDNTVYSYLVTAHWRPDADYLAVALDDPALAIPWPLPLADAEISEKDAGNPMLAEVDPMPAPRTLVIGPGGQLGQALMQSLPGAEGLDRSQLDLDDPQALDAVDWPRYGAVVNAAAYTAVDVAETPDGRRAAWATNAHAPARLARLAARHGFTLVHFSTDYVFDGAREEHTEDETFAPLGVYGQSKAAGDLAVSVAPRHYLLRTSWVVGGGGNFIRTMRRLAADGATPSVVDDQVGRLTFTADLAAATRHLLASGSPFGTYNLTNDGESMSWAEVARHVFAAGGRSGAEVTGISTADYAGGRASAPRPASSTLALDKIKSTGFAPRGATEALDAYLAGG